ncbi:beta-alanine transporter-like [Scylla paramamosain]|uniref:beta-alanine transporter-like n=1 Tax=Scylla paramamosain TaxID=85552 RepID=UPI0030831D2C
MEKNDRKKARDFDDILQHVGSFGKYQKLRIVLLFLPCSFFFGYVSTSPMFEMVVPPHWCHVPGRENTSLALDEWKNLTIPPESDGSGKLSSCQMYDGSWKTINGILTYTTTNNTKKCSHGWEFDQSDFTETDPSAHEWVCDKAFYAHNSLSINLAGRALGTLILPMLADNYFGRRIVFYIAVGTYTIFTLPLLWVTHPIARLLLRFTQSCGFETNYLMPYVIMMELIPPNRRDLIVMLTFVMWTLGMCFMSLVAYLTAHWKLFSATSMIPMIFCFIYWRLLPESPRWLLSKGRLSECADILFEIGSTNGTKGTVTREEVEQELKDLSLRLPANEPLTRAFIYPKLRLRACMLFLLSFSQFLVYGVTLMTMTVLPGNYFLSHLVLSLFEIPSVFVGLAVTHYFGRRFLGFSSLLLGAVCCITAPFCVDHIWKLIGVLAVLKLTVSCTLYLVFLLPSEILPTPIRTSGAGLSVVSGMVGMTFSPHLLHSGQGDTFHYWVLLGITLLGAVTLAPIPETLGLFMPQTFLEGEKLGRGRPLTSWIHKWNVHRYPAAPPHDTEEEVEDLMNGKG